jgi:type IV pilus assembly protein PilM
MFKIFNEKVTLYIDDTSIRLLVCQGQRIKRWGEVKLDPGMIKGSVVLKEVDVTDRLKQLLEAQEVNNKKVTLGFSGLHSLTRPVVLPELPKSMIPEAVAREARRVLPIPLDQLYLSWRLFPSAKGRIQAFMAANPRKTVDSMMKILRKAGLEASHMTIKPLVLTRAVPENTAILIDVQPSEFDIIVLSEGVPQPIRTISLPDTELTWQQKLEMITSDLERTIQFFNSNNAEKTLTPEIPIYMSGEINGKIELYRELSNTFKHPVKPLTSSLKGVEEIDLGRYMVNAAMNIKSGASGREATFPISDLNVLPSPYLPKPISPAKLLAIPVGAAVIGIVVPLVILVQSASANIEGLQRELDATNLTTNQKMAEQRTLQAGVADLQTQVAADKSTLTDLENSVEYLQNTQEIVNGDLNITLSAAPPTVTITGISETGGTLTITGASPDEKGVLDYARTLKLSGRFAETTISSLKQGTTGVDFTLTLNR